MAKALYPLSADPFHYGHLSTIKTALSSGLFDEVIVGIGVNPEKKNKYLLTLDERVLLAQKSCHELHGRVRIQPIEGMMAHAALAHGASVIVRSARTAQDFAYEQVLAEVNKQYGVATIILPATAEYAAVSSSVVKALVQEGALCHQHVHPAAKQVLEARLQEVLLVGVTGNTGAGKTTVCKELVAHGAQQGVFVTHFDCDAVVHALYGENTKYPWVREHILQRFGPQVVTPTGIDRKALGKIIFSDAQAAKDLSALLKTPGKIELEQAIKKNKGIILIDAAYLVEEDLLPWVNYNTLIVTCDTETRKQRICARDKIDNAAFAQRNARQLPEEERKKIIQAAQTRLNHGLFIEYDSGKQNDVALVFEKIKKV